jgi:hypothetical protein
MKAALTQRAWGVGLGICSLGFGLWVLGCARLEAQADASPLLGRATAFADRFFEQFGSVVSEERYEQRVRRAPASTTTSSRTRLQDTTLVSDFLLVQVPGEGWVPFRDVFERDGSKVRDREDRLTNLFLKGAGRSTFDQARKIMDEGSRYNIGAIERNINAPTLALSFLTPLHRYRFAFASAGRDDTGAILEFKETARPTFIATTAGRDLPVSGRFWIDEATGVVRKTHLDAVDPSVAAHITVTYARDETLGIWVPARMDERYLGSGGTAQVTGTATYSRFRRFQVSTSENVDVPGQ